MSKLFMYDTSLEGIEQLMVMVPNFQPRRNGKLVNFKEHQEDEQNFRFNQRNVFFDKRSNSRSKSNHQSDQLSIPI